MPGADTTCVLVVEDDRNIVDLLRSNLLARGFSVLVSTTGAEVLDLLEREQPELALVDLMLPDGDGFELCREMRARSSLGIIVVSARGGETDKVRALNLGADDYLTKPFGVEELMARIHATLRRSRAGPGDGGEQPAVVEAGPVRIDLGTRFVTVSGEPVHLTPTEFALLRELVVEAPNVVPHARLLRKVWGPGYATETEYTRVYVRRLRAKLEAPDGPALIVSEPRIGYRFAG